MVDFRFDIKPLFPEAIVRVTSNLLPHTFRGDRRQCLDATSKMSEIIDRLGQLSATSQGLSKPVTTAQRLRMSENQTIYLLADTEAGHNGAVTGLLKVGNKDLYLFDETGQTRKVERAPSILDFYVHESRQRAGLGKQLFETMLREENWTPLKCSVDRPSEKLLAFFGKHYGLVRTIPQSNNFVLYEGYFNESNSSNGHARAQSPQETKNGLHITNSPNTQLFGATYLGKEVDHRRRGSQQQKQKLDPITQVSPNGRYGARHPTCTMGESRHGQQAAGGQVGTMSRKHASEASLTPSQAKRDTENPRKSPLDALSRAGTVRQQDPFQRRSGLQDVDDAFLATNAFARPSRVRHSGLDGWTDGGAAVPPAGTAAVAPIRMSGGQEQSQVLYQQTQQSMPPQAAAPTQEQQQTPPPQQQSPPVAAVPSQQQFMQQPAAGQPTRHEPHPTGRAHVHHNQQQQHQQAAYDQQQQQQQMAQQETQSMGQSHPQGQLSPRKYQQQTQQQSQGFPNQPNAGGGERAAAGGSGNGGQQQQSGGGAAPPPEPELCTTCPNCQTTIYLVRSAEMGHGDNAAPTQ